MCRLIGLNVWNCGATPISSYRAQLWYPPKSDFFNIIGSTKFGFSKNWGVKTYRDILTLLTYPVSIEKLWGTSRRLAPSTLYLIIKPLDTKLLKWLSKLKCFKPFSRWRLWKVAVVFLNCSWSILSALARLGCLSDLSFGEKFWVGSETSQNVCIYNCSLYLTGFSKNGCQLS